MTASTGIKLIYEFLRQAADEGRECPSNFDIAKAAGCSMSNVYKRLADLTRTKKIVVEVVKARRRIRVGKNWTKFRVVSVPSPKVANGWEGDNRAAECRAWIDLFNSRFGPLATPFESLRVKAGTIRRVDSPMTHSCGGYAQYGV